MSTLDRQRSVFLVVAVCLIVSGCGTALTVGKDHAPYSGVRGDAKILLWTFSGDIDVNPLVSVGAVFDVPFSLTFDTVLLPIQVVRMVWDHVLGANMTRSFVDGGG